MFIKYILIITLTFLVSVAGRAQKANVLTVSGKLDYVKEAKRTLEVTYRKIAGGFIFDSCIVENGNFKFEKQINEPIVVILNLLPLQRTRSNQGTRDYVSVFALPGKVQIQAPENLKNCIVSGSGSIANDDYQVYLKELDRYIDLHNKAMSTVHNLNEDEKGKRITQISDSMYAIRDQEVYLKFLTTKMQSPVSVLALLQYSGEPVWTPRKKMKPDEIERLLVKLPKNFQSYPSIQNLKEELKVAKSTGAGKPIIDFTLEDTAGKKVKLSDFKGQYVFLDFWASWCVPCRKENPNVKNQFMKYKDMGFTVISVSLDKPEARQAWIDAIRKDGTGLWTQLGDLHGFDGEVAKSYYVRSIPTNFLIDPKGKFLDRNLYGEELDKKLAKIFITKN